MKLLKHYGDSGFTLLEVLIVVVIFLFIISGGLFVGFDFYKGYILASERDIVLAALRKARMQAINNIYESPHGVFLGGNYVIFAGESYALRNPQFDEVIPKSSAVNIYGLDQVVFQPLSATTSASGTIVLSDGLRNAAININSEGRINW
jgi:prepilin-type N-terminal cleavage/methylation domain-containing protein